MATAGTKQMCKFGENCYRKNPQHLKQYRHPKRKHEEEEETVTKKQKKKDENVKGKTIEDFFGGKKAKAKEHAISDDEEETSTKPQVQRRSTDSDAGISSGGSPSADSESEQEDEEEDIELPESPLDIKENIKQKFLVDMPEDFYHFWDFCKSENHHKPTDALLKTLGFQLVGPFDILASKHKGVKENRFKKRPNFLLHWRYYLDPPEFQTVIKGDDKTQFHLGYFRDDPKELPVFVAVNSARVNCNITAKGDNLFAAVNFYVEEKRKSKDTDSADKPKLKELSDRLKSSAEKHGYCMDMKSKRMKERDKKVVCKSFHGAGIVVPVDENDIGYREVPETPADLKKMFKKIADSKTESERDKNYEDLQELVTLVQFANDECDYGEGLELGMDLFCYGEQVFKTTILQLLPLAYMLLGRTEFQKIIEVHMKRRSKDSNLSQLD